MAANDQGAGLPIGEALKRTRTQQKIEIRTVEERTKIRIKYLRALENEEWDVLPGPAYARSFLRTYAHFLGLDGDALVDEYRRTVEAAPGAEHPYSFSEPVLERRRRPGGEPPRGWPAWASAAVAVLAAGAIAVFVIGLTNGSSHKGGHHDGRGHHHAHQHGRNGAQPAKQTPPSQPVTVSLVTRNDMEVCLIASDGRALIDSQTLVSGAEEGPFVPPATSYRLDLDSGGAVELALNGKKQAVRSGRPASFRISTAGVQQTDFKGPNCP